MIFFNTEVTAWHICSRCYKKDNNGDTASPILPSSPAPGDGIEIHSESISDLAQETEKIEREMLILKQAKLRKQTELLKKEMARFDENTPPEKRHAEITTRTGNPEKTSTTGERAFIVNIDNIRSTQKSKDEAKKLYRIQGICLLSKVALLKKYVKM